MATSGVRPERRHPSVFLQDFVDVDRSLATIGLRLGGGSAWLAALVDAAGGDAEHQLMRIGPFRRGWVTRDVVVRLGEARTSVEGVAVPIRWEDARRPGFFPVLDGDLEVTPLGPTRCRVVLSAVYRPPFSPVGAALDRALLHRVAESTVRAFLRRLADALSVE